VVLAAVTPEAFEDVAEGIGALARTTPVLLGGEGADAGLAERLGARALDPDPVRATAGMPESG
jgi:hypothetical protein